MSEFKVGDRVKVVENGSGLGVGQIATVINPSEMRNNKEFVIVMADFNNQKYSGYTERFKLIKENNMSNTQYKLGDKINVDSTLVQLSEEPNLRFNSGDLFVVTDAIKTGKSGVIFNGQIIELKDNDGSSYPWFYLDQNRKNQGEYNSVCFGGLAELPKNKIKTTKAQKPTVQQTRTIYSDGVEVSENELKFDGQTFTREDLKAKVRRYQEVLRRPVGTVMVPKTLAKKGKK